MTKATNQVTLVTIIGTNDQFGRGRGAIGKEQYRVIAGSNHRTTLTRVIALLDNNVHTLRKVTSTRIELYTQVNLIGLTRNGTLQEGGVVVGK